jgi:hypothetical protein
LLTDPFQDYLHYLHDSHQLVETAYQLEKEGGFDGEGTAASRGFIRHRLAAGAEMLRNLWYTAWVQSGQGPNTSAVSKPAGASNSTTPTPSRIR